MEVYSRHDNSTRIHSATTSDIGRGLGWWDREIYEQQSQFMLVVEGELETNTHFKASLAVMHLFRPFVSKPAFVLSAVALPPSRSHFENAILAREYSTSLTDQQDGRRSSWMGQWG